MKKIALPRLFKEFLDTVLEETNYLNFQKEELYWDGCSKGPLVLNNGWNGFYL